MSNEEKILEMLAELTESVNRRFDAVDERMDRMEGRMDRMEERIDRIDDRSQRTAVMLEADVMPKLQTLYEGHGAIMDILETLAPKDRVDELEADIIVLKTAVKMLTQEVAELKKAQ